MPPLADVPAVGDGGDVRTQQEPAPTDSAIRVAQSIGITGPLGELGKAIHLGASAGFAEVNARGGVHGRRIELVAKDALKNCDLGGFEVSFDQPGSNASHFVELTMISHGGRSFAEHRS